LYFELAQINCRLYIANKGLSVCLALGNRLLRKRLTRGQGDEKLGNYLQGHKVCFNFG